MATRLLRPHEGNLKAMKSTFEARRKFFRELTGSDLEDLNKTSHLLGDYGYYTPGETRYIHYRLRGYGQSEALAYALAWCRNAAEQYDRRLSHDTGAEGWRALDSHA